LVLEQVVFLQRQKSPLSFTSSPARAHAHARRHFFDDGLTKSDMNHEKNASIAYENIFKGVLLLLLRLHRYMWILGVTFLYIFNLITKLLFCRTPNLIT
jgi:hypothetical protein